MTIKDVCEAIAAELREEGLDEDEFDVSLDEDGGEAAIEADEWTLQLATSAGELTAFLVIDDEPDDGDDFVRAWRAALGREAESAMHAADLALSGALSAALAASGDPFGAAFAAAIRAAP